MTEELYINGTLMDIENVDIVRKYISPFFRDVNILRNNGSYTVKLPPTATNLKAFGLSDRLDMFSDIPYQVNTANYYYDGFPVFENADCILIGVAEDVFIEVQFTWGLSKSKYLPLFEKKLNEIVPNGTTILESDWIVEWKKSNVVYNTGKKYRYLEYVSGERESDVRILDGEAQPLAQAPEPFKSNLKEMTMHPFVSFTNVLDLINQEFTPIEKTKEVAELLTAPTIKFVESVDDIIPGCLLKSTNVTGDISGVGITVVSVDKTNKTITFSQEIIDYDYWSEIFVSNIITFQIKEFDDLKPRLINKGLILGGNKGYVSSEFEINYPLDLDYQFKTNLSLPINTLSDTNGIIITYGSGFGGDEYRKNRFEINNSIGSIKEPFVLNLVFNIIISLDSVGIKIVKYKKIIDPPYYEIVEETIITGGVNINIGGWDYIQYTNITVEVEINSAYWYRIELMATTTSYRAVVAGSKITFSYQYDKSFYESSGFLFSTPFSNNGHYNCLLNLPEMTFAEFIQQMLIMTGMFIGYDKNGDIRFISFDDLKDNVQSGTAYNRSGHIGEITKNEYRFENFAQRNIIKFNNSDDVGYVAHGELTVNDLTLEKERDMYVIKFDLAEQSADGKAEFILYKQRVTETEKGGEIEKGFENNYSEKPSVCVYDDNGVAKILQVLPNSLNGETGFIETYYGVMQKIIERPRVIECEDNMDVITSANIDYEKPFYADELGGRYAVLLELQAPNNEPCVAKLLLINQKL